ncbi:hypothetical protein CLF_102345 [Clonorchis sinensis]|uniref:Uncharacterized protein n=1 Tax=Clonorchis sinensis TaxID=79923 RepID=G7Y7Q3_CLOSI|nr:hypothetical protein CLF_102345 [Clonorchis sinensis]
MLSFKLLSFQIHFAFSRLARWLQAGQLLGRRSMGRAHQSHRSSVNTFACSDVKIQMRPTRVGGVVVTSPPRRSDVRGSNPGTATGYALLMSSNKSETRVQCFPLVWTHRNSYARTGGRPFKREREALWIVLRNPGCLDEVANFIEAASTKRKTRVKMCVTIFNEFSVDIGVKPSSEKMEVKHSTARHDNLADQIFKRPLYSLGEIREQDILMGKHKLVIRKGHAI